MKFRDDFYSVARAFFAKFYWTYLIIRRDIRQAFQHKMLSSGMGKTQIWP